MRAPEQLGCSALRPGCSTARHAPAFSTRQAGLHLTLRKRLLSQFPARTPLDRRSLLLSALGIGCANTLLFYFLPWSGFDRNLNLLGFVVFLLLAGAVWFFNALQFAAHGLIGLAFGILVPMVSQTGGINSPNIVWMPVLSMAALLLINVRWSLTWLGIILLHNMYQYVAVQEAWVSGVVNPMTMPLDSALLTKLNILFFLLLALLIYDLQYRQKMQEVSLRNAELETTQAALLDAQNHKDEFIASVGHELRTPMNAILGLNGVLLDELAGQPQQAQAALHIREATDQLLRVVNDILDISQLEAGRLDLHNAAFALAHTLLSCVSPYQAKAHAKRLALAFTLDVPPTLWVLADRARLVQVVNHLLDNAVKFTALGNIEVRASYAAGQLRVEVQDSGPGIAPAAFGSLFNRFSNAGLHSKRGSGGAGLGLAVSYRLVQQAGGRIEADPSCTSGALFRLEWPMPVHAEHASSPVALPPGAQQGLRFLVVDDHPMNQMVVQLLLRKHWPSCRVEVAQSGESALQRLETSPCDLVLMDLYMPGWDGLQTTQRLRAHTDHKLRATPVIGLTANNVPSDAQRCREAGMHAVVGKPIDEAVLCAAITQALQGAAAV